MTTDETLDCLMTAHAALQDAMDTDDPMAREGVMKALHAVNWTYYALAGQFI